MQNADSAGIFGRQTKPEKCWVCTHKKVFLSAKGSKYEGPLATAVAKHVIRLLDSHKDHLETSFSESLTPTYPFLPRS
jgi:hypothetical protein